MPLLPNDRGGHFFSGELAEVRLSLIEVFEICAITLSFDTFR